MYLDLAPILHTPGGRIPIEARLDFSDLSFYGECPANRPVTLTGEVKNTAGALVLSAVLETELSLMCDRCAKAFERKLSLPIETLLAQELSDEAAEAEIVLLDGSRLDVDELARTAFILGMDTKQLCREDCEGVCARCGTDLNEGPCTCKPEGDPRLAALRQLLPQDD